MKIKDLIKKAKLGVEANSPEILLGLGIAGMAASVIFAVKATPKAVKLIEKKTEEKGTELNGKEIVQITWKCYIPTAVMFLASGGCLVYGNRVSAKRQIVLYSALKTSETFAETYRNKVAEKFGEEKESEVRDAIAEDQLSEQHANEPMEIGKRYLIVDSTTGMKFEATPTQVKRAMNELCYTINRRQFASINDFYDILNAEMWPKGEDWGWSLQRCINYEGALPDVELNPMLDKEDNVYLELVYTVEPYTMYDAIFM